MTSISFAPFTCLHNRINTGDSQAFVLMPPVGRLAPGSPDNVSANPQHCFAVTVCHVFSVCSHILTSVFPKFGITPKMLLATGRAAISPIAPNGIKPPLALLARSYPVDVPALKQFYQPHQHIRFPKRQPDRKELICNQDGKSLFSD